jgi:hypothetical protein
VLSLSLSFSLSFLQRHLFDARDKHTLYTSQCRCRSWHLLSLLLQCGQLRNGKEERDCSLSLVFLLLLHVVTLLVVTRCSSAVLLHVVTLLFVLLHVVTLLLLQVVTLLCCYRL